MTNLGSPSRRYEPFTLVIRRASAYRPSESMLRRIASISCSCNTYGRASLSIGVSYQMAVGSFFGGGGGGVCVTTDDGLIVYGCRLFIPRHEVLSQLHESHQGSVRTKSRARLIVYWHGLDNDLDNIVLSCKHCQERLPPPFQGTYSVEAKTNPAISRDCTGLLYSHSSRISYHC